MISLPTLYDFRHSVGVILSVISVLRRKWNTTVCKVVMEGISPAVKTQENLANMNVTTLIHCSVMLHTVNMP
jgi:hypothetical protein